jgi:hypothetical protein
MSTLRVDKIEPYLSSSIDIVGFTAAVGGATTGSNVFVGNQTVTGSIDITGQFLVNGSPITGSGGGSVNTASLATTGSNVFQGNQFINGTLAVTASGTELKVNNDGTIDVTSTGGFNVIGSMTLVGGGLDVDGSVTASAFQTNDIQTAAGLLNISAGNGAILFMGGNKLEVSGSIDANGEISSSVGFSGNGSGITNVNAQTLDGSDSISFAKTGSNTFEGNQTINGDVIVTGSVETDTINAGASELVVTAPQGVVLAISGNKLAVSGSIEAGNVIAGGAVSSSVGFSGNGSGLSNVDAITLDGLDSTDFAKTGSANTFYAAQSVANGAGNTTNLTPLGVSNVDTSGGMGQTKNISLSANPSGLGGPLSAWTQPTLYGLGSTGPYQIAEFQSQGNYTDGTATFKKPLIVSGSVTITGNITAANLTGSGGGTIDTGSFATTGSNEFVGKQGVTGSFEVSGSIILTGSLLMTGSATFINNGPSTFNGDTVISTIDNLPGGTPGQIAFQGGKMWVYISGQWNEVSFVSAPPPSSYEFNMVYDDTSAAGACGGSGPSAFYSDVSNLVTGSALYTGPGLASPVSNGFYASASFAYEVTGGSGVIAAITACPPSFYEFDLAFSGVDSGSACSNYPSSTGSFYSSNDSLGIGNTIYLDSALTSVASNDTWYSDGTLWYYQEDDAISDSNNCA